MATTRERARALARAHLGRGDPLGWFDALYAEADEDPSVVPWADLAPNPHLVRWLDGRSAPGPGARALAVGCGYGDDAEELARRGYETVAFDLSPIAIERCARRFPATSVCYACADLYAYPAEWERFFDLVVEAYTLQVLPPELRPAATARIASLVRPGGTLVVVSRLREPHESEGAMPWPLVRGEVLAFATDGLNLVEYAAFLDDERPPVRRALAAFRRPRA